MADDINLTPDEGQMPGPLNIENEPGQQQDPKKQQQRSPDEEAVKQGTKLGVEAAAADMGIPPELSGPIAGAIGDKVADQYKQIKENANPAAKVGKVAEAVGTAMESAPGADEGEQESSCS